MGAGEAMAFTTAKHHFHGDSEVLWSVGGKVKEKFQGVY